MFELKFDMPKHPENIQGLQNKLQEVLPGMDGIAINLLDPEIGHYELSINIESEPATSELELKLADVITDWLENPSPEIIPEILDTEKTSQLLALTFVALAQNELIDEVTAMEHSELFTQWDENYRGVSGSIVLGSNGVLYRLIHTIANATHNIDPLKDTGMSMWKSMGQVGDEYPKWSQPLGAFDAYQIGDKVTYNGERWKSAVANNVWVPGVYGWERYTG